MTDDDLADGVSQAVEDTAPLPTQPRQRPLRRIGERPRRAPPEEAPASARPQPPGGFGERRPPPPLPPPPENHPAAYAEIEQPVDDLDEIVGSGSYPMVLRVLAQRLQVAEATIAQGMPNAMQVGQSLIQLDTRLRQIEPAVQHLSTQRAIAEMSLERHTRSTALDLAIKTLTEEQRASGEAAELITLLADAFLRWMKTGENH